MVKVIAKIKFKDLGLEEWKEKGDEYEVPEERAEYLASIGFVDIAKQRPEKEILAERATELGIVVTTKMTIAQLKEAIEAKEAELKPEE